MTDVTYYKALRRGRRATHVEGFTWPEPGVWLEAEGDLVPCVNGLHVCRVDQLLGWLSEELWVVEVDGEPLDAGDKCVARRARLVSQVPDLEWRLRMFAAECAESVLPLFERVPEGRIDVAALNAARASAWAAAWAAAGDDSAGNAAGNAARNAAGDRQKTRLAHWLEVPR